MTLQEAVILAGGFGTRLRPAVPSVPKPLAPIGGRPFLHWLLEGLAKQGLRRVVLATGYKGGTIRAAIGPIYAGLAITYVQEEQPLGTGGAIWAALGHCARERVLVTNGDTWIGAPLASIAAYAPGADLVLTSRWVPDCERYGMLKLDRDRVLGLDEKGRPGPGPVNAGLYILRRDLILRRPMPAAFSFEEEVLAKPRGLDIRAYLSEAAFIDIGTPEDFAAAQSMLPCWASAGRV